MLTDEPATLFAAKLKAPLQISQHLVRALEAGFEIGAKPIDVSIVAAVLSNQLDDVEPQLTRNGYDLRSLVEQFNAKLAEIRRLLRGELDADRAQELMDEMRAAAPARRDPARLTQRASDRPHSLTQSAPETALVCASGAL